MARGWTAARLIVGACAAALCVGTLVGVQAQQPAAQGRAGGGRGGGGILGSVFTAADANKDGALTRDELSGLLQAWVHTASPSGAATEAELADVISAALPQPAFGGGGGGRGGGQPTTPNPDDVASMMAALPDHAPATPARPRKVLVLAKAAGFVHSSIPLAARTVEALGTKTGAWSTDITYDPADITAENLKQYDAVFLDNTTGEFLDDPNDAAVTGARRQALLDFVRGGKGLAGIHAAADSYHTNGPAPAAGTTGRSGGRGRGGFGIGGFLGSAMLTQGDANHDQKLSTAEAGALAGAWFARLDEAKAGSVSEAQFGTGFGPVVFSSRGRGRGGRSGTPAAAPAGPFPGKGTWPDFNRMIGAYFKWHWLDPQLITVKIDDPNSPLTAMFHGREFQIHDETYTFAQSSWSRRNVHVLTSIDYAKMSPEDRAKENWPRTDHDYGLSWIRREGNGRVFYEAHGHSERIYAITPMLEHILAGVQYAIGDLKADDSPSVK